MTAAVEFSESSDPPAVIARLAGDIDLAVAPTIRADIERAVHRNRGGVVLDLSETTYLDSTGIRLLYDLAAGLQREGRHLALLATDDAIVRRVLVLTKLDEQVTVATSLDAALHAVA